MDALKLMVVNTALKDMLRRGYFSICTIDKILEITGGIPSREDRVLLEALHCVNFDAMPPELLKGMPVLIQRVIAAPGIEINYKYFGADMRMIEAGS